MHAFQIKPWNWESTILQLLVVNPCEVTCKAACNIASIDKQFAINIEPKACVFNKTLKKIYWLEYIMWNTYFFKSENIYNFYVKNLIVDLDKLVIEA